MYKRNPFCLWCTNNSSLYWKHRGEHLKPFIILRHIFMKMKAKSSSQIGAFFYTMFANWARAKTMLARMKVFRPKKARKGKKKTKMAKVPEMPKSQKCQKTQNQKTRKTQKTHKTKKPKTPNTQKTQPKKPKKSQKCQIVKMP